MAHVRFANEVPFSLATSYLPAERFAGLRDRISGSFSLYSLLKEHYLVEPVACTPGSGWEKGQVENQVGVVRRRFFVPRPRFKSYAELNAWLIDRCIAWAKAHPHPELRDKTIWDVFEEERPSLVPYVGPFDGFHAVPASVSKTCLVRFDTNKYSVMARAVGRPVDVHAYADRIVIKQDGVVVGEHERGLDTIARLLSRPTHYSAAMLRHDPVLDPVREHPRFATLLR
mgnify:CR=1 FL=1